MHESATVFIISDHQFLIHNEDGRHPVGFTGHDGRPAEW